MNQYNDPWLQSNQQYLVSALAEIRGSLESCDSSEITTGDWERWQRKSDDERPPQIEQLTETFELSEFERAVVLLCAGIELDASLARQVAQSQRGVSASPTFGFALAQLPEPHWSALAPAGPLRLHRLVNVDDPSQLTTSPLRIEERILHFLAGVEQLDERLMGLVERVDDPSRLPPSHTRLADRIVSVWESGFDRSPRSIFLCGADPLSQHAIASAACQSLGLDLFRIPCEAIPTEPHELNRMIRLWHREVMLAPTALLIDLGDPSALDPSRQWAVTRMIDAGGWTLVACPSVGTIRAKSSLVVEVGSPTANEQCDLWRNVLGESSFELNGHVERIVGQFRLPLSLMESVGAEVHCRASDRDPEINSGEGHARDSGSDSEVGDQLWALCRHHARSGLDNLGRRIESNATWDDLILPQPQLDSCRQIATQVRQRMKVYNEWGFATKCSRGLGINALFSGPSGTGKTLAAEVIGNELELDVYHIDLSQVVSKYIGETEKNLRRVFDAAEHSGAILLFDEADALFGKRSEVKDSHDRHANIEVSYLLQRMESYRGLAILTTNMKRALDVAFLRRLRFVVSFPFPDSVHRQRIWDRVFPLQTPCGELDTAKLAQLNVAGGNIRNIALHAAFLAADDGEPVSMGHLRRAAQFEYGKLEKPLTDSEIGGWV